MSERAWCLFGLCVVGGQLNEMKEGDAEKLKELSNKLGANLVKPRHEKHLKVPEKVWTEDAALESIEGSWPRVGRGLGRGWIDGLGADLWWVLLACLIVDWGGPQVNRGNVLLHAYLYRLDIPECFQKVRHTSQPAALSLGLACQGAMVI